jgi:hypothetical protein
MVEYIFHAKCQIIILIHQIVSSSALYCPQVTCLLTLFVNPAAIKTKAKLVGHPQGSGLNGMVKSLKSAKPAPPPKLRWCFQYSSGAAFLSTVLHLCSGKTSKAFSLSYENHSGDSDDESHEEA